MEQIVKRKREKRIYFHVSDEEFELIKRKMELTGIRKIGRAHV